MRKNPALAVFGLGVLMAFGCQSTSPAVHTPDSRTGARSGLVLPTILHRELAAESALLAQLGVDDPVYSRNDGLLGRVDADGFGPIEDSRIDTVDIQRTTWGRPRDHLIIRSRTRRYGSGN